ncbi:MAG TPA: hypothetical protein VNR87_13815 [Flavisolibacter sp.]|nr:hypothetical protein [Flavisolibacter sp.]
MIAFTICSNNYLSKAQVLAASIREKSDAPIFLVLADEKNDAVDYDALGFDNVIIPEELPVFHLKDMKERYNVIEFNTALKPFAFTYFFESTNVDSVYYFDPDMRVYEPLETFEDFWRDEKIVLTPHILSPLPFDGKFPGENLFLNHGNYNLGFIGLRRSKVTQDFLHWWSERMKTHCIINLKEGFFVDQLWANLLPVFYKQAVKISDHPGWNMAYWNLHERVISKRNGRWYVNESAPLFFYHFSSFDPQLLHLSPGGEAARFRFADFAELELMYQEYKRELERFEPARFRPIPYFNGMYPIPPRHVSIPERVVRKLKFYLTR